MPSEQQGAPQGRRRRLIQGLLSAIVVVAIFGFALPQVADFSAVWRAITAMTPLELISLGVLAIWNLATYWLVLLASLPGSNVWQAIKVNQTSTAVANTAPGGAALGLGVTYAMLSTYGFPRSRISLSILATGVWNNFIKLGMPVVALAILALEGGTNAPLISASLVGVAVLAGAVALFAMMLRSDRLAYEIGARTGRLVSRALGLFGKPPRSSWGESAVRFRGEVIELVRERWAALTAASVVSHVTLYVVLLVSLRSVGVSQEEVGWAQALAAFAFIRLISALPITPGGLGVVELGLTAALVSAGGPRAGVVAAILVFRALTYALPIPLGLVTYIKWKRGAAARRARVARHEEPAAVSTKGAAP
jgi:putative heme transporter